MKKIGTGFVSRTIVRLAFIMLLVVVAAASVFFAPSYSTYGQAIPSADGDHDGIPDDTERLLAERYAPVMFLHPEEENYPVNVDWLLSKTYLEYFANCNNWPDKHIAVVRSITAQAELIHPKVCTFVKSDPDCKGKECLGNWRCTLQLDRFLNHPANTSGYNEKHCSKPSKPKSLSAVEPDPRPLGWSAAWVLGTLDRGDRKGLLNPSGWKTYTHVYPSRTGGVIIQYWHLFPYNELGIPGIAGEHGGDWDGRLYLELVLRDNRLQPARVWFPRHERDKPGDVFDWNSDQVHKYMGTHPMVAIEKNGHASYASPYDRDTVNFKNPLDDIVNYKGGPIVWTYYPDEPYRGEPRDRWPWTGGTVWQTWTGGQVRTYGKTEHRVENGTTGGIVNLGEYNPGKNQASSFLSGQFYPLEGQAFIRFSGRWGSRGQGVSEGHAELNSGYVGPVFSGWDERTYTYKTWYHEAAFAPATSATHPWIQPVLTVSTDPGHVLAGDLAQVTIRADDLVRQVRLSGKLRVNDDPQAFETERPFTYAFEAGFNQITLYDVAGYPASKHTFLVQGRPWTIKVSPDPLLEGVPLTVAISATDDRSGAPVSGLVSITDPVAGVDQFQTNVGFPFVFHTTTESQLVPPRPQDCKIIQGDCDGDHQVDKPTNEECQECPDPKEVDVTIYPRASITARYYEPQRLTFSVVTPKMHVNISPDPATVPAGERATYVVRSEDSHFHTPVTGTVQIIGGPNVTTNTPFEHAFNAGRHRVIVSAPYYPDEELVSNVALRRLVVRVESRPNPIPERTPARVTVFAFDALTGAQVGSAVVQVRNPGAGVADYPANREFSVTLKVARSCSWVDTNCRVEQDDGDGDGKPDKPVEECDKELECHITGKPSGTVRAPNFADEHFSFNVLASEEPPDEDLAADRRLTSKESLPGMPRTGAAAQVERGTHPLAYSATILVLGLIAGVAAILVALRLYRIVRKRGHHPGNELP
ncbi:MAG: hypothetical protein M3441_11130 [Chloroflexota bacterium]|nr:hypothetical protein [Chloroflexota bacterium]